MLQYIINQVTKVPSNGIAVKNNLTGKCMEKFATFSDIKENGFDTVEAKFSDIISNAKNEVTVYLKRRNGSSSVPMLDADKQPIQVKLKPLNNTNVEISQNVVPASAVNSVDATALNQQPPTPQPTMNPNQQQPTGLMGGLNQAQMQVFDVYSKADKYTEAKESLTNALQTAQSLEEKYKILDRDHLERGYEIRDLKKEIAALKETHTKELADSSRPLVSSDNVKMVQGFLPMILGTVKEFSNAKTGLAGATQTAQPQFSVVKKALIEMFQDERFTDAHCQLFIDINNKGVESPEVFKKITELAQTT